MIATYGFGQQTAPGGWFSGLTRVGIQVPGTRALGKADGHGKLVCASDADDAIWLPGKVQIPDGALQAERLS